jgi:hypothetical protein
LIGLNFMLETLRRPWPPGAPIHRGCDANCWNSRRNLHGNSSLFFLSPGSLTWSRLLAGRAGSEGYRTLSDWNPSQNDVHPFQKLLSIVVLPQLQRNVLDDGVSVDVHPLVGQRG